MLQYFSPTDVVVAGSDSTAPVEVWLAYVCVAVCQWAKNKKKKLQKGKFVTFFLSKMCKEAIYPTNKHTHTHTEREREKSKHIRYIHIGVCGCVCAHFIKAVCICLSIVVVTPCMYVCAYVKLELRTYLKMWFPAFILCCVAVLVVAAAVVSLLTLAFTYLRIMLHICVHLLRRSHISMRVCVCVARSNSCFDPPTQNNSRHNRITLVSSSSVRVWVLRKC